MTRASVQQPSAPIGTARSIPQALRSPIGDGVLRIARSEAGLLALMAIEFEARTESNSFRKTIAAALRVSERYVGDLLHGKANATPGQLHTIAQACGTLLFERWLCIHFITSNGGSDGISED